MDDFIFVSLLALVYAAVAVGIPYLVLFALTNVVYRLASGRFFRWVSWRTVVPFLIVLVVGWYVFYGELKTGRHFLITH